LTAAIFPWLGAQLSKNMAHPAGVSSIGSCRSCRSPDLGLRGEARGASYMDEGRTLERNCEFLNECTSLIESVKAAPRAQA
jgi:hypothetical protein